MIQICTNYEDIASAITLFDNMLSGISTSCDNLAVLLRKSKPILNHLLFDQDKSRFNEFIYSTWNAFISNKTQIIINMWRLHEHIGNLEFLGLIFSNFRTDKFETEFLDHNTHKKINTEILEMFNRLPNSNNFSQPRDKDDANLIKPEILNIFSNATSLTIDRTQYYYPNTYWPLSLDALLTLIKNTNIKKVKITAHPNRLNKSWISSVWKEKSVKSKSNKEKESNEIVKLYKQSGYNIQREIVASLDLHQSHIIHINKL